MKEDILRCIYRYKFIDKNFAKYFNTSEEEFVKLYLNKNYLILTDFVNIIREKTKFTKGFKEFDEFFSNDYNNKDEYFGTFIDYFNTYGRDDNLIIFNKLLQDTYEEDILSAIICAVFIVNDNHDTNFFVRSASIHLFLSLPIFSNYKNLFFAILLLFILNNKQEDEHLDCRILISRLLKVLSVKELIILISEQKLKEYFQLIFDKFVTILDIEQKGKYKVDDCHDVNGIFFFLSKTFDTYKWINSEEGLNILRKSNIFYKEHAFYLEKLGKKDYFGEMMMAELEGNCQIF